MTSPVQDEQGGDGWCATLAEALGLPDEAVTTVDLTQRELEDLRDGYDVDTLAGVLCARDVDADLSDTTARTVRLRKGASS